MKGNTAKDVVPRVGQIWARGDVRIKLRPSFFQGVFDPDILAGEWSGVGQIDRAQLINGEWILFNDAPEAVLNVPLTVSEINALVQAIGTCGFVRASGVDVKDLQRKLKELLK